MNNKYKVKVNNSIEFDITDDDVSKLNAEKTADNIYHVLQNNKPFKAELVDSTFNRKKYSIKVNNHSYDVDISNPLDLLIDKMGFTFGSSKQVNSIKAPMPGLILDIHVKEGQEVKEDEGLLILEAMKMENVITSPRDAVIKSVNIAKGDAIDKGHLLIEFE
ncbi:MAG: biotin attachment protein [Flavobacteriaceae bacterium]|nr:acetyl-CoA carboxylase biotin carboxyl carrier protein subunit [Bacteroidia bacterium]NNL15596.1 biotin attachment protein [Flavobacteriaceae bacterium]